MTASCGLCGGITLTQTAGGDNFYLLPVSCPKDGGRLEHVTGGLYAGTESNAICRCATCGRGWQILAMLRPVADVGAHKRAAHRAKAAT